MIHDLYWSSHLVALQVNRVLYLNMQMLDWSSFDPQNKKKPCDI
jgi:hypothetical protein